MYVAKLRRIGEAHACVSASAYICYLYIIGDLWVLIREREYHEYSTCLIEILLRLKHNFVHYRLWLSKHSDMNLYIGKVTAKSILLDAYWTCDTNFLNETLHIVSLRPKLPMLQIEKKSFWWHRFRLWNKSHFLNYCIFPIHIDDTSMNCLCVTLKICFKFRFLQQYANTTC